MPPLASGGIQIDRRGWLISPRSSATNASATTSMHSDIGSRRSMSAAVSTRNDIGFEHRTLAQGLTPRGLSHQRVVGTDTLRVPVPLVLRRWPSRPASGSTGSSEASRGFLVDRQHDRTVDDQALVGALLEQVGEEPFD